MADIKAAVEKVSKEIEKEKEQEKPAKKETKSAKIEHVKEQFGGNVSDIPVTHPYWQERFNQ